MTLPIRREESAYSIVSGAALSVYFSQSCTVSLFAIYGLCYQALGYVREAYQTLARGDSDGGLGLFGYCHIREPIQDCQQYHVYT